MLVHPNPMRRDGHDHWVDTHLNRVEVKSMPINSGKYRERWVVYARRRKGSALTQISRHITESQAVVEAQTLANRFYRLSLKKKRRVAGQPLTLSISNETADTIERLVTDALQKSQWAPTGDNHERARQSAREAVALLQQEFQLRKRS